MDIGAGLSREERETVITLNEQDDVLEISTSSPIFARKLEKLCQAMGATVEYHGPWDVRATLPVKCLRLSPPRVVSDAQREHLAHMTELASERRAAQLAAD